MKGERREAKVPETPVWVPTLEVHGEARAAKLAATRRWVQQRFVATKTPSNWHRIRHPFAPRKLHVFICVGHSQTKIGSEVFEIPDQNSGVGGNRPPIQKLIAKLYKTTGSAKVSVLINKPHHIKLKMAFPSCLTIPPSTRNNQPVKSNPLNTSCDRRSSQ